jgi:hypothetical protein
MECQLRVCQAYCLSLSLKKSFIFPKRFEFVGNDVCPDGNRPAQSKHQLLQSWPSPEIVRDVAKFIGFAQFYTDPVAAIWTVACQRAFIDIREAILSDPCLL